MTGTDPMHRIHAVKDSIRAKTAAIPAADHNGVIDDDPDRPRYGAGLVTPAGPKPSTKEGKR